MCQYYIEQIQIKTGNPKAKDEQIRVTYVSDKMSYDEVRFAGIGLIDEFIHDSNDFETRELQSQQSNYLVASAGSYQYLYAFKRYQKVEEDQDEKASQTHSQYMFDVVKINHIENVGHQTSQVQ